VKKVEMKDGAVRETERGSTALNYNLSSEIKPWEGSIWSNFNFLFRGGY
jgi:hypothetical protein